MSAKLRLEYLVARRGPAVALALVVVGTLAVGAAGWAYANPQTTEVTDRTHTQTVDAELHSSARVTNDTELYESGTRLRDPPIYLYSAAPKATLNLTTKVPPDQPVRVTQEIAVVYTATRDGETFWNRSERLTRTETTTRSGSVTTDTRIDPRAIQRRVDRLQSEVGTAGSVDVRLRVAVSYETDRYRGEIATTAPIELSDDGYAIETASAERTHGTPVTRTVTVPRRNGDLYLGVGALGAVAILLGAGVAGAYFTRLRDVSEEPLEYRVHRNRYSDWISRGAIPEPMAEPSIRTESLEGLVDVAIDTDTRVVYDPDRELYAVFTEAATYYFEDAGWWFDDLPE